LTKTAGDVAAASARSLGALAGYLTEPVDERRILCTGAPEIAGVDPVAH